MASNLTITTVTSLNLYSSSYSATNTKVVYDITEVDKRTALIGTSSEQTLLLISNTDGLGQTSSIDFFIIKNLDTSNFIRLRLKDTSGDTVDIKLMPSATFFVNNVSLECKTAGTGFTAYSNIDTISAQADTGACYVEYMNCQI